MTRARARAAPRAGGPLLRRRPGRRRDDRRHGRDARVGNERGALRDDARERPRPDGRHSPTAAIIRTGGRARKSAAGYDLTRLFVGSEGTLGVITEVALRLFGIPEAIASAACAFETIEGAVDSVIETMQLGIPVARIELLDEVQVRRVQQLLADRPPRGADAVHRVPRHRRRGREEQAESLAEIAGGHGGGGSRGRRAPRSATRSGARGTRRTTPRCALRPARRASSTDVCVPISRLAECIVETKRDLDERAPAGADRRARRRRQLPRRPS